MEGMVIFICFSHVITTPEHPFYVSDKGWIGAVHLRAGDILALQSVEYVIVEMVQHEIQESPVTVYSFEVEDFHTYYVGESSLLVHNLCRQTIVRQAWVEERNLVAAAGAALLTIGAIGCGIYRRRLKL